MFIEYKPGQKYAAKDADISDDHASFDDCGYILTDTDLIVDIDSLDHQTIQKLVVYFKIKTQIVWTERGAHLYFKKPDTFRGAKGICALGFEVEYKHFKNSKSITIKRNGQLRKIENHGVREDFPQIFKSSSKFVSLVGIDDGEGRNQALFKHRLNLGNNQNVTAILSFINEHIFATPLSDEEFQSIIREISTNSGTGNEYDLATFIIEKYKTVNYLENVYYRKNGEFYNNEREFKKILFEEIPNVRTTVIDEVYKQVAYRSKQYGNDTTFDIKLNNGILRNGQFIEVQYEEFTPYNIKLEYDPNIAPVKDVDEYIGHLTNNDPEYAQLLWEVLGHTLVVDKEFKRALSKFFIFIGGGGNGKGTLLTIIRAILGTKNCSGLSIDNMTDERYFATLKGKLVNLGDDIHDKPINNEQMKVLKNISSCDYTSSRELYKQSHEVELTTSLIFTSNHVLKSFEKGESYKRRIMWLPMYNEVKKINPLFISMMTRPEALKYFISNIIKGYMRLYENGAFTKSAAVEEFNYQYHQDNNNAILFIDDLQIEDIQGKRSKEVHDEYTVWAEENGLTICSQKMLNEVIYQKFKLVVRAKKLNGRTMKVYSE